MATDQWGGGQDQLFAPTRLNRKKWKPFQRGPSDRAPANASQGPRTMLGRPETRQEHQAREPQAQGLPRPSTEADSSVRNTPSTRPGPLAPDHPLKREMDELKETRKRRQLYWAGLIEDLGDDEWGNPANYDRQRWEDEERKADDKFEDLAGQIKLAEMGYAVAAIENRDHSRLAPRGRDQDSSYRTDSTRGRIYRRGRGRLHTESREQDDTPSHRQIHTSRPLRRSWEENLHAPAKKTVFWSRTRQTSAVDQWMKQMGKYTTREESSMEHQTVTVGSSLSDVTVTGVYKEFQPDKEANDVGSLPSTHVSTIAYTKHYERPQHSVDVSPLPWTAVEEVAFEEAEQERENERLLLGRYLIEDNEARASLEKPVDNGPPRTAIPVGDPAERLLSKQTTTPPRDGDLMSALMANLLEGQPRSSSLCPPKVTDPSLEHDTVARTQSPKIAPMPVSEQPAMEPRLQRHQNPEPTTEDFINIAESPIEIIDMHNDTSSDHSPRSPLPVRPSDHNGEADFLRLDSTPPKPPANNSPEAPATQRVLKEFSALGLHYRQILKVNGMFSPTGSLLPPDPISVAARLRELRGSYREYSEIIRRGATGEWDWEVVRERSGALHEGVSAWVNPEVWRVDWRETLDM
ncbi:hypothetical protein MMC16_002319 [Acarospora aff. strigata]|nr:hypothetical protein [Acarospora aff. strigata]